MNGFITAKDAAEKWNMSVRNIQNICTAGKLDGAMKFGNAWAIPEDAEKPQDGRITSGSYKNWRKKSDT
ncbi:MAG: helix-turn-helix domain-containing protein [Suipraeoptans sp.]